MDDIERLRRVFDEGPLGVAVLDATYRLVDVNSRFCDMLGYGRDELMALTFPEFTHPEDISKDVSLAAKLFRGEIPRYEIEKRFIRKNGEIIWGRLHASVVHDESGEPEFSLGMVEDITEKKKLEEILQRVTSETSGEFGAEFFQSLVGQLAMALETRYAFVGELVGETRQRVQTVAVWAGGESGENFEYDLAGTPCENVVSKTTCLYPSGVQEQFPEDRLLADMDVASYLGTPLFGPSGDAIGLLVVMHDEPMTEGSLIESVLAIFAARAGAELERKRTEDELRRSEERFRRLSEGAIEGTAITDQGIILDANLQFARLYGYELSEIVRATVSSLVAPESREHVLKQIAEGNDQPYENWGLRKDGTTFPVQAHGKAIEYEGRTVRVTNIRDITERRRADDALRESEEKFRTVTEASPAAILVIQDGQIPFANAAMIEGSEYSAAELTELPYLDLLHPEDHAEHERRIAACLDGSEPYQTWRHLTITKSGIEGWFETTIGPTQFQGKPAVIAVATDVTEQMRTEEALQKTQERLVHLADTAPAAVTVIQGTAISYANVAFERMTGYSAEELSGLEATEIVHPDDREAFVDRMARRLAEEEIPDPMRFRLIRKDGEERWAETSANLIEFEGEPAVFAITFDVTERVRAEEALRTSEERFQKLVETAGAGIMIVASQGKIKYANPAIERVTGRTLSELQTMEVSDIVHPENSGDVQDRISRLLQGEQITFPFRQRIVQANGDERWVESSATVIEYEGEPAVLGVLLDITDRVRTEEELQKSEVRFQEMAETSQAAIFIVSGVTIVYANAAGERLTGRSLEELQTIDFWETAHPEDREALVEHFDGPESAGQLSSPFVYRVLKPNGEERWVEASAAMTSFQGENAGTVILMDVTDRVLAEEATQRAREELEGKVERQMLRKNPYELTFRELTVLHHIAAGEADKEIAAELGISPLTAQNHVASILRKMDAPSRTAAGVRAVRDGLVD